MCKIVGMINYHKVIALMVAQVPFARFSKRKHMISCSPRLFKLVSVSSTQHVPRPIRVVIPRLCNGYENLGISDLSLLSNTRACGERA
jgi:hypothetical protein